eukprot:TRINITY_DN21284_c0_g1_i1.p1 TRINITY_DN21284_c0_g1~~TRINITY_DN21284_c0_g1_i1.p1  ORF type:complete len:255 (+),score=56.56 TRINITY_DN21284_c0_g1_i1:104-868(+)
MAVVLGGIARSRFRCVSALAQARTREIATLIMGPPGGGKGTISKKIVRDLQFTHLSTGDMLRGHVARQTPLGQEAQGHMAAGGLVPDRLIIDMVLEALSAQQPQSTEAARVLLDGFPRTVAQAEELDRHLQIAAALNVQVPREEIVRRISGRWVHPASGRVYALDYNPPREAGRDDETGEPLVQREDDKPEAVRKRLEAYDELTAPVLAYYEMKGVAKSFDGSDHPELVAADRRSDAIWASARPWLEKQLLGAH